MPSKNVWGIKPQTFFKKTIDKVANSWYNNYRKKKREVNKMYFECNDWLYGTYLCKLSFLKGIITLLFGRGYAKFIPWWKIEKK